MTGSDMWDLIFQDPGPGLMITPAVLVLGGGWYLRRRRGRTAPSGDMTKEATEP